MCAKNFKLYLIALNVALVTACGGSNPPSTNNSSLTETVATPSAPSTPTSPTTPTAPTPPNNSNFTYVPPLENGDGWTVVDANSTSVDVATLESLMDSMQQDQDGFKHIDGLTIARNGQLIFHEQLRTELDRADRWADNQDIELHILNSATKSVMSLAMGIAIEQGLVTGVDALVHDYLITAAPVDNWNQTKAGITIENYLTMQHGYQWDEWDVHYFDPANQNLQMINSHEPIQFLLDLPMATQPGSTFAYSSGVSYALGIIISNASGKPLVDFMQQNLFDPMQIQKSAFWSLDGQLHAGSALYLTQRDMLKFGQLVLDKGRWNGQQIVSEEWIDVSIAPHLTINEFRNTTYGYQWWAEDYQVGDTTIHSVSARGFGGQFIYIFEQLNAVVVFTGHRYESSEVNETNMRMILQDFVLPSLR